MKTNTRTRPETRDETQQSGVKPVSLPRDLLRRLEARELAHLYVNQALAEDVAKQKDAIAKVNQG